jgi:hypothetical protein
VTALRELKLGQPELADAVDLQLELLALERRVHARLPLAWLDVEPERLRSQQAAGRPLLHFQDIPLDWTEFRLMFRSVADILRRYDSLDRFDHDAVQAIGRSGNSLEPMVVRWFNLKAAPEQEDRPDAARVLPDGPVPNAEALDQVVTLAMRPFLARAAEVLQQRTDLSFWSHSYCPLCGGDPEFAVIAPTADRFLICGRCAARWRFGSITCPFCQNDDRGSITSFTSREGVYRIYACEVCRRYLKAYDERNATRPLMLPVDLIATLPLDAAAIQKGYVG